MTSQLHRHGLSKLFVYPLLDHVQLRQANEPVGGVEQHGDVPACCLTHTFYVGGQIFRQREALSLARGQS